MNKKIPQPDPAKLRRARENAGLTAKELSDRTGISERMVRIIELGYSRPYADQVALWAQACAVEMPTLFSSALPRAFSRRKNFNKVEIKA